MTSDKKPLVYSCSGCSSAAQMANFIAIKMDREGLAEMSCIAGVGGGVKPLVKTAQSGREIYALDGCVLKCVHACLTNQGVKANQSWVLTDLGVAKQVHVDFDKEQALGIFEIIKSDLNQGLK